MTQSNSRSADAPPAGGSTPVDGPGLKTVVEALGRLRFGAIQLTVHDGKLVQVDVTERHRYAA